MEKQLYTKSGEGGQTDSGDGGGGGTEGGHSLGQFAMGPFDTLRPTVSWWRL